MSDGVQPIPAIRVDNASVRFLIRYYRREVTLRETVVGMFDRQRLGAMLGSQKRGSNGQHRRGTEFWALRDINVTVHKGETLGLVGRNGSGKTTLLKTMAGILGPDRGHVSVSGKVACLLSFGVGFNPTLSGRENVFLNGSILGLSRHMIEQRFDRIVEMSGLDDFINAPVRTYSAGMRGRLGFSIAVHIEPDILLLDEVLGVGDAAFRAKAGSILDHLRKERKTVVLASHDMGLIRKQCHRAVWLEKGEVFMEGPSDQVTAEYLKHARATAQPQRVPNHA